MNDKEEKRDRDMERELFTKDSSHYDTIKCPECATIQQAEVKHTALWNSYVHDCEKCGYTIMESEWDIPEELDPRITHINATPEFLSKPENIEMINKMVDEASKRNPK